MYKVIRADKDTYITNRVIANVSQSKANVGDANTLDLFKMYGVTMSGTVPNLELSRILIHFPLDDIRELVSSGLINTSNPSFECRLKLHDVYGGQTTPTNFDVSVNPLSRSFDEGMGRDVVYYSDQDVCNFLSSSRVDGAWFAEGCALGSTGSCDYISGITTSQTFVTGEEDLDIDVTAMISSSLANSIPDEGFRIAFSSSEESDTQTYFVKRFCARTAYDVTKRPELIIKYDDSVQDDTQLVTFDDDYTLFFYNYSKGSPANVLSSSIAITGSNSIKLKMITEISGGWYDTGFTGSQHAIGVYSATINLNSSNTQLAAKLALSSSVDFYPVWESLDQTVSFLSGAKMAISPRTSYQSNQALTAFTVTCQGLKKDISPTENLFVRVNLFNRLSPTIKLVKRPFTAPGIVVRDVHYSIRNIDKNIVVVPFDTEKNSTRMSSDASGMWFKLDASSLAVNQRYVIDVLTMTNGVETRYENASEVFRVADPR